MSSARRKSKSKAKAPAVEGEKPIIPRKALTPAHHFIVQYLMVWRRHLLCVAVFARNISFVQATRVMDAKVLEKLYKKLLNRDTFKSV